MKKTLLMLSLSMLVVEFFTINAVESFALSALKNIKQFTHTRFIKPFDQSLKKILKTSKVNIYDENNEFKGEMFGVTNIQVLPQNGASCGYNALKNGILIAEGRRKELRDEDIANYLYGTMSYNALMGFWRRAIIAKRTGILKQEDVKNIDHEIEKHNKQREKKGYNAIDLSGELLDDGEIDLLIQYERKDGCLLSDSTLPITIIEDVGIFDVLEQGDMNNEEYQIALEVSESVANLYGLDAIREKCKDSTYKHVFIVGTMKRNQINGSSDTAHWFTLVIRNGKCYVADSLGCDRSEDYRVKKIIELIGKNDSDNF